MSATNSTTVLTVADHAQWYVPMPANVQYSTPVALSSDGRCVLLQESPAQRSASLRSFEQWLQQQYTHFTGITNNRLALYQKPGRLIATLPVETITDPDLFEGITEKVDGKFVFITKCVLAPDGHHVWMLISPEGDPFTESHWLVYGI